MDDGIRLLQGNQLEHAQAISNIGRVMAETRVSITKLGQVPGGVSVGAEEGGPHIVVDADDIVAEFIEIADRLRSDEPAAACDQYLHEPSRSSISPTLSASDDWSTPPGRCAP